MFGDLELFWKTQVFMQKLLGQLTRVNWATFWLDPVTLGAVERAVASDTKDPWIITSPLQFLCKQFWTINFNICDRKQKKRSENTAILNAKHPCKISFPIVHTMSRYLPLGHSKLQAESSVRSPKRSRRWPPRRCRWWSRWSWRIHAEGLLFGPMSFSSSIQFDYKIVGRLSSMDRSAPFKLRLGPGFESRVCSVWPEG